MVAACRIWPPRRAAAGTPSAFPAAAVSPRRDRVGAGRRPGTGAGPVLGRQLAPVRDIGGGAPRRAGAKAQRRRHGSRRVPSGAGPYAAAVRGGPAQARAAAPRRAARGAGGAAAAGAPRSRRGRPAEDGPDGRVGRGAEAAVGARRAGGRARAGSYEKAGRPGLLVGEPRLQDGRPSALGRLPLRRHYRAKCAPVGGGSAQGLCPYSVLAPTGPSPAPQPAPPPRRGPVQGLTRRPASAAPPWPVLLCFGGLNLPAARLLDTCTAPAARRPDGSRRRFAPSGPPLPASWAPDRTKRQPAGVARIPLVRDAGAGPRELARRSRALGVKLGACRRACAGQGHGWRRRREAGAAAEALRPAAATRRAIRSPEARGARRGAPAPPGLAPTGALASRRLQPGRRHGAAYLRKLPL